MQKCCAIQPDQIQMHTNLVFYIISVKNKKINTAFDFKYINLIKIQTIKLTNTELFILGLT